MKKSILFFAAAAMFSTAAFAQKQDKKTVEARPVDKAQQVSSPTPAIQPAPAQTTTPAQNADASMKFVSDEHSFGTIPEGPSVTYDFEFKNIGKEPIVLSGVQASCGCTTPTWTKDPVLPGKTGKISATYNTQGRPGSFVKTITINSNVGTKVVKITGTVEKAPESSVPSNNNSMMKH